MNETEFKSKLQIAIAAKEAFGFSEVESRIFAGLENQLLNEAAIKDMTCPQLFSLMKDMTGDQLKAYIQNLSDPLLRHVTFGDIADSSVSESVTAEQILNQDLDDKPRGQDLFHLEKLAKQAEPKPTVDSFLAKLKTR